MGGGGAFRNKARRDLRSKLKPANCIQNKQGEWYLMRISRGMGVRSTKKEVGEVAAGGGPGGGKNGKGFCGQLVRQLRGLRGRRIKTKR